MTTPDTRQLINETTTVGASTGKTFGDLAVLEDAGHEKVPRPDAAAYYRRPLEGDRTDVDIVTRALTLE